MEAHNVSKPIERAAVRAIENETRMAWRVRQYGSICLTRREYEAVTQEMRIIEMTGGCAQQQVADAMKISQQRVGKLLKSASNVLDYLASIGVEFGWYCHEGRYWRLDAPVASEGGD